MEENKSTFNSIDEYITSFPSEVQGTLQQLRKIIRDLVPEATEKISYQMPTFALHGNLVHFAAYKNHIGFYPAASGIREFEQELSAYKWSKGAVQFPIDKPMPYELISRIILFRAAENMEKANSKSTKKKL